MYFLSHQRLFHIAIASTAVLLLASMLICQAREQPYVIATATPGGTYYPVGVAIATLIKVKLAPEEISLTAIRSAGSRENLELLRNNQAQFAILQGLFGAWAWHGDGPMQAAGPHKNLRAITTLWQNVEHFTVDASFTRTGNITELRHLQGEPFSIGQKNSGAEGSGRYLLNRLGIAPKETLELVHLSYGPSAEALQSGTIKGMNTPGGVPVAAVSQAFAALRDKLVILGFSEEQLQQINSEYDLWKRFVIPANTYESQSKAVNTIAQPNFLAVRSDIDADTVYLITKTIYANLSFLNNVHKATKIMALNKALNDLPIPLHPGAARYYKEVGITIPEERVVE
jgi:hypothetical protein